MEALAVKGSSEALVPEAKKKKVWTCDVCRQAKFDDFEEACRHEKECEQSKIAKAICGDHHFHIGDDEEEAMVAENKSRTRRKKRKSDDQSQIAPPSDTNNDDVVEVLDDSKSLESGVKKDKGGDWLTTASKKPKKTAKAMKKHGTTSKENTLGLTFFSEKKEDASSKQIKVTSSVKKGITGKQKNNTASAGGYTKKVTPTTSKSSKVKTTATSNVGHLAGFFEGVDTKQLMAEHLAAEFQAKRLEKQKLERERQRKREQAFQSIASEKPANLIVLDDNGEEEKQKETPLNVPLKNRQHSGKTAKSKKSLLRAPRFPNPTHVIPAGSDDKLVSTQKSSHLIDNGSEKNPPLLLSTSDNLDLPPLFPPSDSFWSSSLEDSDPVSNIMSRLAASARNNKQSHSPSSGNVLLWSEKYRISKDDLEADSDCGISINIHAAADKLRSFVEDWKVERHKANQRAEERQRKLVEPKKRIKRHHKRADEQDIWLSDEDEDLILPSLMLISGPVASGKTSLVHAVTAQCECKVLEINTSEKRSGAALKQMLEEATQSHSSLDLMKKSNRLQKMWSERPLVDSDSEDDEGIKKKGDNLAVILIDEVDLLYEQDNGFWAALSELTKRAKCPIVLTSNSIPIELRTFRYKHIELERPTPVECVVRIQHILANEGFTSVDGDLIHDCAKVLQGDMRRLCHELQCAFESGWTARKQPGSFASSFSAGLSDAKNSMAFSEDHVSGLPFIETTKPDFLPANQYSLFTMTGTGFLSLVSSSLRRSDSAYHAIVHVNGQECPDACILDDETAIAVFSPSESGRNTPCAVRHLFDDDLGSESHDYVPVTLSSALKRGILSTTSASLQIKELSDGTKVASKQKTALIELRFAQETSDTGPKDNSKSSEVVSGLMKEGVDAWISRNGKCQEVSPSHNSSLNDTSDVEEAERRAQLASDAALLESGLNSGVSFLAGPCRGFGLEMTGESHMHSSEKSDALNESRLFELGWKDDCFFYGTADAFMCHPRTSFERRLLHTVEQEQRGRTQTFVLGSGEEEILYDNEDWSPPELCEEDCLLPHASAPSILTFSSQLFSLSDARSTRGCLEMEQRSHYWTCVGYFEEIFFYVTRLQDQLFARGLSRWMSDTLHETEYFDRRLVLDYVPMLRCMAVYEAAADRWYSSLVDKTGESATTSYRRTTRRSKQEGRDHYFKVGAFRDYFGRNVSDLRDVNEVTDTLCSRAMCVQMAK